MTVQTSARVSRETDAVDLGIYGRLYAWAAWATDRRDLLERHDDVAGDFRLTFRVKERIRELQRQHYPPELEAIERAVASMRVEHDLVALEYYLRQYFLEWKKIETIARDEDLSEFHVTEYLQRAMREVAHRLPAFEGAS